MCFEFGIELDEITSEREQQEKERGAAAEDASDEIIYKIDIPANRYDLLCMEGLVMSLLVFLEKMETPRFSVTVPAESEILTMNVEDSTSSVRPFVVCAVLRGVTFTADSKASFIALQDKLHQNICRKRTLVAIGTHDLDTIEGPFTYAARAPGSFSFVPLNKDVEVTGAGVMDMYAEDPNLKAYLPIIRDEPAYPVIFDAQDRVLSLPPIINGDHSKITTETKNVFIECTATDHTKACIVLNTMVSMFAQYAATPFQVEAVKVVYPEGDPRTGRTLPVYPDLTPRQAQADIEYITTSIGVKIEPDTIAHLLSRMMLDATISDDGSSVSVLVPPTRSDVMHACDIMEDVAIAYGFNNIPKTHPKTSTVGRQLPINKLTDLLRIEVAQFAFVEVLTMALCSHADAFENLNRPDDGATAVCIGNPKSADFELARPSLMGGLLKTLQSNSHHSYPQQLFEVSDVILKDPSRDVGARNERRLAAIYTNSSAGFEVVHGLLDRVMAVLGVPWAGDADAAASAAASSSADASSPAAAAVTSTSTVGLSYRLVQGSDPALFPGFQASIMLNSQEIGVIGVVHPTVLSTYKLSKPCSYLEINIEPFLVDYSM